MSVKRRQSMNNVKVTLEEVVRHFLRTQSHKPELKGKDIPELSLRDAKQLIEQEYQTIAEKMMRCDWRLCFVDESLFEALKALCTRTWWDLSDGTLRIVDVAKNIMEKQEEILEGYAPTRRKVLDLMNLTTSELFDWRIIVQFDEEDYTVLDGTCRAVAMAHHFSQHGFSPFLAYIGFTKTEL